MLLALLAVLETSTNEHRGDESTDLIGIGSMRLLFIRRTPGTEHARDLMRENVLPSSEGFNQYGTEDTANIHYQGNRETDFGGVATTIRQSGVHNLGVYVVDAVYLRCGNPPL